MWIIRLSVCPPLLSRRGEQETCLFSYMCSEAHNRLGRRGGSRGWRIAGSCKHRDAEKRKRAREREAARYSVAHVVGLECSRRTRQSVSCVCVYAVILVYFLPLSLACRSQMVSLIVHQVPWLDKLD